MKKRINYKKKVEILGLCTLLALFCVSCNKEEAVLPVPEPTVEKPSVTGGTTTGEGGMTSALVDGEGILKERDLEVAKELVFSLLHQAGLIKGDASGLELHWKTDWRWGDYEVFLCYKTDKMTDPDAIVEAQEMNVQLIADYYTLMKEKEGNCEPDEWQYLVDSVEYMWPAHSQWGQQEDLILTVGKNTQGNIYIYSEVEQWATSLGLSQTADATIDFSSWSSESELILRQYDVALAYDLWSIISGVIMSAEVDCVGASVAWDTATGRYTVTSEDAVVTSLLQQGLDGKLAGNLGVAVSELFLVGPIILEVGRDQIDNPYIFCHNPFVAEIMGMPAY